MAGQRYAFVLRLWLEENIGTANASPTVRGSLQTTDSDQVHYFISCEKILELVYEITGWCDRSRFARPTED